MFRITTDRLITAYIIILAILFIPYVANCFFAYPQTDDFCYTSVSADLGFIKSQCNWYTTWTGRFFSTALLSINPLVYKSLAGYRFILALFILFQLASLCLLTKVVTNGVLTYKENIIFATALLASNYDQMEDIRSGLYWMAGVVTYQVAASLMFVYLSNLLVLSNSYVKKNSHIGVAITILCAFFLQGTNEVMLVLNILITVTIIYYSYNNSKNNGFYHLYTLLAVLIGSLLSLLAPGNYVRINTFSRNEGVFVIVYKALLKTMSLIELWVTAPSTLILLILVFVAINNRPRLKKIFIECKLSLSLSILFGLTFMSVLVPYLITGLPPENRILNMTNLLFLSGWTILCAIMSARFGERFLKLFDSYRIAGMQIVVFIYIAALFGIGSSNYVLVTNDILSGNSYKYSLEVERKEKFLIDSLEKIEVVEDIQTTPHSLFFDYIRYNGDHWVNKCYASYLGKNRVSLKSIRACQ